MSGITVSIVTSPDKYSMVNNEMWYQLTTSTSSTQFSNFKYVVDLYSTLEIGPTVTSLGRYLLPPRPVTGDGLFSPAKMLRTQISQDLETFIPLQSVCTNSIVPYAIKIGYEYQPILNIIFFVHGSDLVAWPSYTNNLALILATSSAPVQTGDIITIAKNNKQINPSFAGTCSVLDVSVGFGNQAVLTDKPMFVANELIPFPVGSITNILHQGTVTSSTLYGLNGDRQYTERTRNFGTEYLQLGPPIKPMLTNYTTSFQGQVKPIFNNQYECVHALLDPNINTPNLLTYNLYDSNWNLVYTDSSHAYALNPNNHRVAIASGTAQLAAIGLTLSFYNASFYSVSITQLGGGFSYFSTYYYGLVCNPSPNPNVRLTWLNPLGGMDHWNFNWKSVTTTSINRTEYKQVLPWNYNVGDRGTTLLTTEANDTQTITTDFLTEFEAHWLKELIFSKEVWVINENTNQYLPIIITDSSFINKTKLNDKLFALTISFKYSYNINTTTD